MSGAGFFAGTMSPAKTVEPRPGPSPTACSRTARTDGSAEVEATASCQPAAVRLARRCRAMPGRPGISAGRPARV